MSKGWILCKPRFQDSYETNRLIEEFKNQNIGVGTAVNDENNNEKESDTFGEPVWVWKKI